MPDEPQDGSDAAAAITLIQVTYTGQKLTASWEATVPPGFSGFMVYLDNQTTGETQRYPTQLTEFETDAVLNPADSYTLHVRILVRGIPATSSQTVSLIVQTPPVIRAAYDGVATTLLQWSLLSPVVAPTYAATLYSTSGLVRLNQTDIRSDRTTFDKTLQTTGTFYRTQVAGQNGIVIGPLSPPLTLITAAPQVTLGDYDGQRVLMTWQAVDNPSAQSYFATLSSTDLYEFQQTAELRASFDLTQVDPENTYLVNVGALSEDGVVLGPVSDNLPLLVVPPEGVYLSYTGLEMILDWMASANPRVTSYQTSLRKDGAPIQERDSQQPPQSFEQTLTAGSVFSGVVRLAGDRVLGPPNPDPALAPYLEEIVYDYDDLSRLQSATYNGVQTLSFEMDLSGNLLSVDYSGQ